jgi:voltage-gated potassium channel
MQEGIRLRVYIALLSVVVIGGTIGLIITESLHPFDALYFVIVTIATVGFGDISPHTFAGKVVTLAIILIGVGCFVAVAANVIEYFIVERESRERLRKMNMLVGVFFSEIGTSLLRKFSAADPSAGEIRAALVVSSEWSDRDFIRAGSIIAGHKALISSKALDLEEMNRFLSANKPLMISMLENPYLIDHDTFTELMQALFHVTEELRVRDRLTALPETDYAHLSGDINRVYSLLIREWLVYMQHLKQQYPYLFSLAMRTNPFDVDASPIVT